jgi:hypothetical protein
MRSVYAGKSCEAEQSDSAVRQANPSTLARAETGGGTPSPAASEILRSCAEHESGAVQRGLGKFAGGDHGDFVTGFRSNSACSRATCPMKCGP